MSVLHHMIVMLTADTKEFSSQMGTAQKTTQAVSNDVKTAAGSNRSLADSLKTAAMGFGVFAGAGVAVKKFLVDSINETVEYNKQIREMTMFTGLSADETSRLVQVADDWGIGIGQLRTSLQMAIKNGFNPTIENLAALADEFVNTADKTAFAEKYSETFGRQWANIIPLLSKGGDALREQAAAVDESLIATEEAIAASREYELALDELGDIVTGLKYKLGNELIPVMVEFINTAKETDAITKEASKTVDEYSMRYVKLHSNLMNNIAAENMSREAIMAAKDEIYLATDATNDLTSATDELTDAQDPFISVMGMAEDALKDFNIAEATRLELTKQMKLATGELTQEELDQKEAIGFLTKQLELGRITMEEYLAAVNDLASGAETAGTLVKRIGDNIALLPDSKEIEIVVTYNERHKGGGKVSEPGGPTIDPGDVYPDEDLDPGLIPGNGLDSMGLSGIGLPLPAPGVGIGLPFPSRGRGSIRGASRRGGIAGSGRTSNDVIIDLLLAMLANFSGTTNNWNLTINEAGRRGNVVMDFALLQAMARG